MLQIISMTVALFSVIIVNIAASLTFFNGLTTIEILNRLPILIIPANYVFFILPFIYTFLALWVFSFVRQGKSYGHSIFNLRTTLFITASILKIAWILLWHYNFFDWSIAVMAVLLATLATLYFTYPKYENNVWQRVPISCYFGWTLFAFVANINFVLTLHEWNGWGLSVELWTVIFLTFAAAVALHFLYHHRDFPLNIMFMWAFIGISVKNGFDALFVSSAALFLTAVIGVSLFVFKPNTNTSP